MMNQFMKETVGFDVTEFEIGECFEISSRFETINGIVVNASEKQIVFLTYDKINRTAVMRAFTIDDVTNKIVTLSKLKKSTPKKKKETSSDWGDMMEAMTLGQYANDVNKDGFDVINDIKTFAYQEKKNQRGW